MRHMWMWYLGRKLCIDYRNSFPLAALLAGLRSMSPSPKLRNLTSCRLLALKVRPLLSRSWKVQQILQLLRRTLYPGEEISRPLEDVLAEIAVLADQGVKEITLLGQNVNAYRGITKYGAEGEIVDLALLLEYIHEMPGIERIRYTTSHPREFTARLIDAYSRLPKLVSHVHLPVQSGSDLILAAMKRGYTTLEYKSIIRRLRAARPDISLTSDFIIGFPGETETDFEATMRLVEEMGFDDSFSFIYSPRPGTPAADLPDSTAQEIKLERLRRLQEKIAQQAQAISQSMVGIDTAYPDRGYFQKEPQ